MLFTCHSYYSLRYGTMKPETLLQKAVENHLPVVVMADINNTSGVITFVKEAQALGIKPIAGIDFRNGDRHLYTAIARNNDGFRELNEFLSLHLLKKKAFPVVPEPFNQAYVIYPFGEKDLTDLRDNEFVGVQPQDINRLRYITAKKYFHKLIVFQTVTFYGKHDFILHKHLRAIHHNTLLSKITPEQMGNESDIFRTFDDLLVAFADFPEILQTTKKLIEDCSITFDFTTSKNKNTYTESLYDDKLLLEKLALDGWKYRYGNDPEALRRVHYELEIIDKQGFSAYFLITWDIVRYSMSRGFYHVGRGSGANSIVAYCLKITDVDPIELNLYFERFLNPKRSSPPDFDIDFSWRNRDDIHEYIFKRYGTKNTALLGAMNTFKGKSIVRELGKVYGLPKAEIDTLAEDPVAEIEGSELYRQIFAVGALMEDFPNLRTIHAGGVMISEEPITCYTALDLPPKGFPTTQWDMYVAEDFRFDKLDILSQRGIGHINDSVEIIRQNRQVKIDIHRVQGLKDDPQVKHQLKIGETIGCFYIESPAMRGLLKKLHCDNYISLVAASSIIRPGVAKSGMMREYINRFHHPESFTYLHPVMKEQLEETYGVMVFQEDVLKVCHHFAGLDLADADVLRRAMSGKFRSKSEFQRIIDRFFENCRTLGRPDETAKEVWRQIESFAGYSFSKAHSASYAVESFQSLYLKAHYPLEFMVAVINNFGGFYRTWVYVNEARRCGGRIELPCVNKSLEETTIYDDRIYLGFNLVANLEHDFQRELVSERMRGGEFRSLEDFLHRVSIGIEHLVLLIRLGSFRFIGKPKMQLLWEAHMLLSKHVKSIPNRLFDIPSKKWELPGMEQSVVEAAYDEIELLGFPVTMSWLDLLQTSFRGEVMANDLTAYVGKTVRMVGLLVTIKYVSTSKRELMHFGSFLDLSGEFFETVHFPQSLKNWPFAGHGVYLILGKVVAEFGHPSIEVEKLAKLPVKGDPRR
ncbi:MAG TPA: DNA polymerase III subunit alpha [Prolixibacteraceae bacterium]|nr:DNA polymerase III subunit alpha [Prolixibacteraceae bacterium]